MREPKPTALAPDREVQARREALLRTLGANVRGLRKRRGLSRLELATRAGLSPRFVAQLEAGEGNISVAKLEEIACVLAVPLPGLFGTPRNGETPSGEAEAMRRQVGAMLEHASVERLRGVLAVLSGGAGHPAAFGAVPPVIALVGLRGAGKSTVGPLLAGRLGIPFAELDDLIQEAGGLALAEMFELHGEQYYRMLERECLRRLIEQARPIVVAVSGGIVTDAQTFRLLGEQTLLVWLRARPEEHMKRVIAQGDHRPIADRHDPMAELRALLQARVPYYQGARLILETDDSRPAECAARLAGDVRRLQSNPGPARPPQPRSL
jgi:XRE family aerobic/anaerobic benzoate catabolism transcriptional regulator